VSERFFQTIQNKMHWAAHGHTAAEVIAARANAGKPNMGLTSWTGSRPRKADVAIAKNYLTADELDELNRIVTLYLEFAELQARSRRLMYMRDWIAKLDEFLRLSERDILTHAGKISHEVAVFRAEKEYGQFEKSLLSAPTQAEKDFEKAARRLKEIPASTSPTGRKGRDEGA
jgi:hypothetical protein